MSKDKPIHHINPTIDEVSGEAVSLAARPKGRLKAYSKMLRALIALSASIYELAFGEAPPKAKEALKE